MADILNLQGTPDTPLLTPGEEKTSRLSYVHCHQSNVSVALCRLLSAR